MNKDLSRRLHEVLPKLRQWIDELIVSNSARSRQASSLGFNRLATYYPADILASTRVVLIDKLPLPPLEELGLAEFSEYEHGAFSGITYRNMIFILKGRESDSILFHELVHVRQWSRLGPDRFLLAYAFGLERFGYRGSPLEEMAYSLQRDFEQVVVPTDLIGKIDHDCDAIWTQAKPAVSVYAHSP